MKYENANDVLPKDLLEQVQKIAGGRLLYIPIAGDKKLWGEKTGNRFRVKMRNREIREKFASGASADTLSAEYFLTPETIRNIIYEKKSDVDISVNTNYYWFVEDVSITTSSSNFNYYFKIKSRF